MTESNLERTDDEGYPPPKRNLEEHPLGDIPEVEEVSQVPPPPED